jgi:hypothetical protein
VGVQNRRQWGRILAIVLGIFHGVVALVRLAAGAMPLVILDRGYAIPVLIILFTPRYAAEFS